MNSKTTNKSADIRPLIDCEIEQVSGGFFCWPAIVFILASLLVPR